MPHGNLMPLGPEVPLAEARLTARKLQAAGVPTFLRGEAAALISPDPDRTLVCVEVDEEDLEDARRILAGPPVPEPPAPVDAGVAFPKEEGDGGLVTVEVFYDSLEAQHAADLLRARGIPCGLRGTSEGALGAISPEIPRLRLEVYANDLEQAFEILGFTVEDKQNTEDTESIDNGGDGKFMAHRTTAAEHIQEPSPRPRAQLQRHPVQPPAEAGTPAPETAPATAEELIVPDLPPTVEAGQGGGEGSLVVFLLLVAVAVLVLIVLLLS